MAACLIGASPAMAEGETALCEVEEDPCAAEHVYPEATSIEAVSLYPLLLTAYFTIKCEQSTLLLETTSSLAAPLEAGVEELQFTKCFSTEKGTFGCSIVTETTGTVTMLRTGINYTGHAALQGAMLKVTCPPIVNCLLYLSIGQEEEEEEEEESDDLEVLPTAEQPARLRAYEALFEGLGVCPQLWKLDADYEIGSPAPLYVSG